VHQARTFGVLSPFVGGDYYGAIIAGINRAAASEGNRIIAFQTLDPGSHGADFSGVPEFRRPVAWRHLDGLIILPGAVHASYARAIQRADKPIVLVGHQLPDVECATALVDNRAGVRAAVAHLLDHGHERIAFGGDLTSFDLRERHEGYREALIEHGVAVRPELCFEAPDNHESGGETLAGKLIRADMPATAIVVGTDRNAIGLVRRLTAASRQVPGELAIVGFDDIADTLYSRPSLSTVRQPLDHLGRAAYELVRDAAAGSPGPPAARKVATQFVPRESCGCPARGLQLSEEQMRAQFADNVYLQMTLNTQYELGIELLGSQEGDARGLSWLRCTPALGGCLGLWPDEPARTDASAAARSLAVGADSEIEIAGEYRTDGDPPASLGETMPVSAFPPLWLLALADGAADQVVFVVPVRNESRDWGVLAAVGRIQDATPPGREMMNHSGSLLAVALDRKAMHHSLQEKERSAIASAHYAGMAEIAIDVLHNVGNILASVKVTCTTLQHSLEASRADNLGRVAAMLQERAERGTGELAAFMSEDERGRKLVAYLAELSRLLERENHDALAEVGSLAGSIALIEQVIAAQQVHTGGPSSTEAVELFRVVNEALALHAPALDRNRIEVVKNYRPVAPVHVQRTKLGRVLSKLLQNAEDALLKRSSDARRVIVNIGADAAGVAYIRIQDSGDGIPVENLSRIFAHGFSTRKGHPGFGLHYCANSMTEMGGRITVESDGPDTGAAFVLIFGRAG